MARFCKLTSRDESVVVVNVDLIRYIRAGGGGITVLYFSDDQALHINQPIEEVARVLSY